MVFPDAKLLLSMDDWSEDCDLTSPFHSHNSEWLDRAIDGLLSCSPPQRGHTFRPYEFPGDCIRHATSTPSSEGSVVNDRASSLDFGDEPIIRVRLRLLEKEKPKDEVRVKKKKKKKEQIVRLYDSPHSRKGRRPGLLHRKDRDLKVFSYGRSRKPPDGASYLLLWAINGSEDEFWCVRWTAPNKEPKRPKELKAGSETLLYLLRSGISAPERTKLK